MKLVSILGVVLLTLASWCVEGQSLDQVRKMEASGDVSRARSILAHAVEANPKSVSALTEYAQFLESYGDPACREVYTHLLEVLRVGRIGSAVPARYRQRSVRWWQHGPGWNSKIGTQEASFVLGCCR